MDTKKILNINMLGEFTMSCPGGSVRSDQNSRSKKVLSLLEYLITFRSREISQAEIIDLLWPDDDVDDPANTLKTLLHRVRSFVEEVGFASGKDIILSRRGTYAWNNDIPVSIDAESFDALCLTVRTAEGSARREILRKAIDLYKGDFLPKNASESWVVPINTYYHSQYLKLVHMAIDDFNTDCRYDEIISVCQRAILIDPYDEALHLAMITALNSAGMQQGALQHYNYVKDLFMTKFGVNPSNELTALYKDIMKTSKESEMDLRLVRDELTERELIDGAFFCEYEFFKDIYRLNARAAARNGQVVYIALVTVMDGAGQKLTQKKMNVTMERLQEVINHSLRRGDVFTRYSVSQYLLMLPSASFENSNMVLQRVSRNFKQSYPHMNILLHYSTLPVEPLM